jgi:hypothetical protein
MNDDLSLFLQAWTGGTKVSEPERQRILQRFESDAAFRAECVEEMRLLGMIKVAQTPSPRWLDLNDALGISRAADDGAEADDLPSRVLRSVRSEAPSRSRFPRAAWRPLAAAAAVVVLALSFGWQGRVQVHVVASSAPGMNAGTSLGREQRELDSGTLELLTDLGARVVIEAPARFEFLTAQRLRLMRGRLSAEVPPNAKGFTVVTASGEVVDLGTRFGVDADAPSGAEVHVFEGEVIARAGERVSLKAGEAGTLQKATVSRRDLREAAFISPAENGALAEGLRQGRAETAAEWRARYEKDAALVLWEDFERGEREGSFRKAQGRWPGSVALDFADKGDFTPLNLGTEAAQFTLLAWVRLDRLPEAMQSIYHGHDYDQQPGTVHWLVRQSVGTMLLPVSGTRRLDFDEEKERDRLRLYPASQHSVRGSVGRWSLMAVTYDSVTGRVCFYQDGRLDNEERVTAGVMARFGEARLGNWNRQDRVLSGRLDDFIVMRRVLPAAEVHAFYEATKPY